MCGFYSEKCDSLQADGPGIAPQWWAKFSAPAQNGPGAHPASCTMGAASSSEVKRHCMALTIQPHLAARLKKE